MAGVYLPVPAHHDADCSGHEVRLGLVETLWPRTWTAFLSPPVAMSAYYLKSVVPEWELKTIYGGMMDFMVLQVIGSAALLLFPDLALCFLGFLFD